MQKVQSGEHLRFTSFRHIWHSYHRLWRLSRFWYTWRRLEGIAVLVHISCFCDVLQPSKHASTSKYYDTTVD